MQFLLINVAIIKVGVLKFRVNIFLNLEEQFESEKKYNDDTNILALLIYRHYK